MSILVGNIYSGLNMGIVVNNGLTGTGVAGDPIQLGGLLVKDTVIGTLGGNSLEIDTGANGINLQSQSTDYSQLRLQQSQGGTLFFQNGVGTGNTAFFVASNNGAEMAYAVSGQPQRYINLSATKMEVGDTGAGNQGLVNAGDYEANFVPRSLITKQYVSAGYGSAFSVARIVATGINSFTQIGSIQTNAADVNGWNFGEVYARVVITNDAPGGATVGFNPTCKVYDIYCNFWTSNGVWQNFVEVSRSGLGSNSAQGTLLQGLYTNASNTSANLQLRLNNSPNSAIGIGWNVTIVVFRPQSVLFTPLSGTGTDATAYTSYNSMFNANYIDGSFQLFKPIKVFSGNTLQLYGATSGNTTLGVPAVAGNGTFNFPINNGTNGWILQTDGAGNTSWVAAPSGAAGIVAKNKATGLSATGNLITYANAGSGDVMLRISTTSTFRTGTGTFTISVSFSNEVPNAQTISFPVAAGAGNNTQANSPICINAKLGTAVTVDITVTGTVVCDVYSVIELLQ